MFASTSTTISTQTPVPYIWGIGLTPHQLEILARKVVPEERLRDARYNFHTALVDEMDYLNNHQTFLRYDREPEDPLYIWVHLVVPSWDGDVPKIDVPNEVVSAQFGRYGIGSEFGKVQKLYAKWPRLISSEFVANRSTSTR